MARISWVNKTLIIGALIVLIELCFYLWYFEIGRVKVNKDSGGRPLVVDDSHKSLQTQTPQTPEAHGVVLQKIWVKVVNVTLKYYPQMKEYNNIRVSYHKNCSQKDLKDADASKKFVVVTNFIYFILPNYKKNLFIGGGLRLTDANIELRIMEVVNVLQSNLNHPFIEEVHVLVKEDEAIEYLRHLPLKNSEKMVIHVPEEDVSMKTQFKYAGQCLVNKTVAISHQDNQFGKGWDKFRPDILKEKRVAYALTRHAPEIAPCAGAKWSPNCDPGYKYVGSHDVFMFYVRGALTSEQLKDLGNITPNLNGMENVLIWVFINRWNYKDDEGGVGGFGDIPDDKQNVNEDEERDSGIIIQRYAHLVGPAAHLFKVFIFPSFQASFISPGRSSQNQFEADGSKPSSFPSHQSEAVDRRTSFGSGKLQNLKIIREEDVPEDVVPQDVVCMYPLHQTAEDDGIAETQEEATEDFDEPIQDEDEDGGLNDTPDDKENFNEDEELDSGIIIQRYAHVQEKCFSKIVEFKLMDRSPFHFRHISPRLLIGGSARNLKIIREEEDVSEVPEIPEEDAVSQEDVSCMYQFDQQAEDDGRGDEKMESLKKLLESCSNNEHL
eukprot:gene9910-10923_t